MEQTECSEMLAYKIQTPGNYPEESVRLRIHHPATLNQIHILLLLFQVLVETCAVPKKYYCLLHFVPFL